VVTTTSTTSTTTPISSTTSTTVTTTTSMPAREASTTTVPVVAPTTTTQPTTCVETAVGLAAVRCRLGLIADVLRTTPMDGLGGRRSANRLRRCLGRAAVHLAFTQRRGVTARPASAILENRTRLLGRGEGARRPRTPRRPAPSF